MTPSLQPALLLLPAAVLLMAGAGNGGSIGGDGGGSPQEAPGDLGAVGVVNNSITAVLPGESAKLACPIPAELYGTRVSWIRRKDLQLLAVDDSIYTKDTRFFVSHSRHFHNKETRHSQVWFLHMVNVTKNDEGEYECQTSSHPHVSFLTILKVPNATSVVQGPAERLIAAGSGLRLVCVIKDASTPPKYVFWYRDSRMINYDSKDFTVSSDGPNRSVLTVTSATEEHTGNYTCDPSNASPSSVMVHVVIERTEPNETSGRGTKDGEKTPVRQLQVKSASSAGPRVLPQTLALFILAPLLLDLLTVPRVFHYSA